MTNEELKQALEDGVNHGRQNAARVVGPRIVLAIEAMGYRIVPAMLIEPLQQALERAVPDKKNRRPG